MILGFSILFFFIFIGEIIANFFKIPIPGSVIGMILLTLGLYGKIIKDEWIRPAAKLLIENMALLFIPAGIGLMIHFKLISENLLPITSIIIFCTIFTLIITGFIQQKLEKIFAKKGNKNE